MTHLEALLGQISRFLKDQNQPWALVGGLAVSVRTEPRFTRDIDLAVAVADDTAAEVLIHNLGMTGFRVLATVEQDATHRLATARLTSGGTMQDGLVLDLLFASSGVEPEICQEAEFVEVFPSIVVPVARLSHLMVLKVLARDDRTRPQDAMDLRQLMRAAQPGDLDAACALAELVEARGYNRERKLSDALRAAWAEFRP